MKDLLRRTGRTGGGIRLGLAIPRIMTHFPASETSSLLHAFRTFLGGKLLKSDDVDFHGIRVRGVSRGGIIWSSEIGKSCSSPEFIYTKFLVMKGFGLHNPFFQSVRRVLHG